MYFLWKYRYPTDLFISDDMLSNETVQNAVLYISTLYTLCDVFLVSVFFADCGADTMLLLKIVILLVGAVTMCVTDCPSDWPSLPDLCDFKDSLTGELLLPGDPGFDQEAAVWNKWFTNSPAIIVLPENTGKLLCAFHI